MVYNGSKQKTLLTPDHFTQLVISLMGQNKDLELSISIIV